MAENEHPLPEPVVEPVAEPSPPQPALNNEKRQKQEGPPLWMPLLGLIVAFGFAILVGIRVCPTLSGVVLPPDPPLPPGPMTLRTHESKAVGADEWLYATTVSGCDVAHYYEQRLGDCTYDPDASCRLPGVDRPPLSPGQGSHVAQCYGKQSIGAFQVQWTVYISNNNPGKEGTVFRVYREAGN